MLKVLVVLVLSLLPTFAFAMSSGGSGGMGRWNIFGFYGLGSVNPSDANSVIKLAPSVPALNTLSSNTLFGGGLGYMLNPKFRFDVMYDQQDSKNPSSSTNFGSNAGFELMQNTLWGILNYNLIQTNSIYVYVGAGLGYSLYSHATFTANATKTEYDADKNLAFIGQAGIGVMLGRMFSVFFEGGYDSLAMGTLKSNNAPLVTGTGTQAKMDMSGARGEAGLRLHF